MKELLVLKIGGSVISDKTKEPNLNEENIAVFASEIKKFIDKKSFIIIAGGGSYGHYHVKNMRLLEEKNIINFSKFHSIYDIEHMDRISKIFEESGLPVFSIRTSSNFTTKNNKINTFNISVFKEALKNNMIPVLCGDLVLDSNKKWVVISGDDLAPFLAKSLKANKIIHFTDVGGVYTGNPKEDKNVKIIPEISSENFEEIKKYLSGSSGTDVTGGMLKKVIELMNIGIESHIVSYHPFDNVVKAISGENIGTRIL